jgi:hypothetical protein
LKKLLNLVLLDGQLRCPMEKSVGNVSFIF